MQIRVDEDDKIVATDILITLCSIKNRRVMVTLFTCIDFADLPKQVIDMIDIYVNEWNKEVRAKCFQVIPS